MPYLNDHTSLRRQLRVGLMDPLLQSADNQRLKHFRCPSTNGFGCGIAGDSFGGTVPESDSTFLVNEDQALAEGIQRRLEQFGAIDHARDFRLVHRQMSRTASFGSRGSFLLDFFKE
jgi:hypothetical protein